MRKLPILIVTLLCIVRAHAAAVSVPAKSRDAVPIIEVRINGSRPLWFALDTGSSRMLLDSSLIDSLGLTRGAPDSIQGAGAGRVAVTSIDDEITLAVGSLTSRGYHFDATDLSHIGLRDRIDGILGYDFLERHVVLIDYARSRVTIDPAAVPKGSRAVPIRIEGKWPFVDGTLL
ncbi:MAG TPA: retropepsin-like aspartic protease, partial [Thermoanaerobaculia bacterium]|nr:retropepsin-like aspartic protease [Thermoanaerobaculia bacterium]